MGRDIQISARRGSQGNILVISLGLLLMMTFLGIGLFYTIERDFSIEEGTHERAASFDAAEAGGQTGLYWLEDRVLVGNYPDTGIVNGEGGINGVVVPVWASTLEESDGMDIAQQGGCYGYARFVSMDMVSGSSIDNDPDPPPGPDVTSDLKLTPQVINPAKSLAGLSACDLLMVPATIDPPNDDGGDLLSNFQYEFFIEVLPERAAQSSGSQVGVSGTYGQGGYDIEYPYHIRAVGRHLPNAAVPANFDSQVIIDLWAHYIS